MLLKQRFWIKNFPAHFGIDEALKGMISKFWNLVRSKGHKDHIKFIEVSNMYLKKRFD